jgi:hypothetical protein
VRIGYLPGQAKAPLPSLGGAMTRYRPILAVRVSGPAGTRSLDGLLDSGSDDTIFPEWIAPMIGVDLAAAIQHDIHLAGRSHFPARASETAYAALLEQRPGVPCFRLPATLFPVRTWHGTCCLLPNRFHVAFPAIRRSP